MAESRSHKLGKGNAARTEIPISGRRRLDAIRGHYAIEVERSGTKKGLAQSLSRLRTQRNKSKILRVPQQDMDKAVKLTRSKGMNVTVTNLSKTKRRKA
ncbi:hypothetical protein L0337_27375 [candidate division KSB1 bacterium]|nr:hypothetical protein [candidate division KSB1 bacterium]